MRLITALKKDLEAALKNDPAANSRAEVIFLYPGFHAVVGYRLSNWLWHANYKFLARLLSRFTQIISGVDIHPGAEIGAGFFIDHAYGVVIGETAIVGNNVTIFHGVTLGGKDNIKTKRHPTIGDNTMIGAGAKILGDITIGSNSIVGANSVVTRSFPDNSTIVGIPGKLKTN